MFFGLVGIGFDAIQGLRHAEADEIVGVDLKESKSKITTKCSMTNFVETSKVHWTLVSHLVEVTGGGAD